MLRNTPVVRGINRLIELPNNNNYYKLGQNMIGVFDAKALGSASNSFALEAFKSNPLVAIQHDGDLSNITDNTRLNSLVSHELMTVNEKFRSAYSNRFKCFLFMGTNKPVKIITIGNTTYHGIPNIATPKKAKYIDIINISP